MRVRAVRDARGEHRTTADFLLLLGASVIVAAVGVAAFWLADEYRLNGESRPTTDLRARRVVCRSMGSMP